VTAATATATTTATGATAKSAATVVATSAAKVGPRPRPPKGALDSGAPVASPNPMTKKRTRRKFWLLLGAATAGVAAYSAAYQFALRYRERVGLPHRSPVDITPAEFGLAYENVEIPAGELCLSGWFVPATDAADGPATSPAVAGRPASAPAARPGIVVVHGWESNRGRTFPHVRYLHAAGFHCLVFDIRGHGDSPSDDLPINVPEFADDTAAAVRYLAGRPEVTHIGVLGHSMGAAGAIVAAAREPLIEAVVSASSPSDLVRMTRKTFQMAEMSIPEPIATPLAWFTAALLLAPRRRAVVDASASYAAARYHGPLLLIHGAQDRGVPVEHLELIARAAEDTRDEDDTEVETLVLPEFGHRWLYEDAGCRRRVAGFFARSLGSVDPGEAAAAAESVDVQRPDDPVYGFGALASKAPATAAATTEAR
jgi:pimeloyl-ACP methyl ester carboxylesterase